MYAIAFTEENLPKILQYSFVSVKAVQDLSNVFLHRDYYFIKGVVSSEGEVTWKLLPAFFFKKHYIYDPDIIQTDWDLVTEK